MSLTAKDIKVEVERDIKAMKDAAKIAEENGRRFDTFKSAYEKCVRNLYLAKHNHLAYDIDAASGLFMLNDGESFRCNDKHKFFTTLIDWLNRDTKELCWVYDDERWVRIFISEGDAG